MADQPDYQVGTVAITTGTKALTGVLTLWTTAGLEKGDQFGVDGYPLARIDTVNSDGSITLLDNWRGPTLAAGTAYFIRFQADSRFLALLTAVRQLLSQPILTAFSGLTAAADKLPYFTGATTMALVDFKLWARSLLGLTMAADKLPYGTGANTMALADFTAFARTLLDDANAGAAQTTLGMSTFVKTLLDDADAGAVWATLGGTASMVGTQATWRIPGANGLMIIATRQNALYSASGNFAITFPTAFGAVPFCVAIGQTENASVGARTFNSYDAVQITTTGWTIACRPNPGAIVLPTMWIAVGIAP